MQRLRQFAEYIALRVIISLVQIFPIRSCEKFAKGFSIVATDWIGFRKKVIEDNLQKTYPDLSAEERLKLTRGMWQHLVLMICEIAHAPRKIHDTNWKKFLEFRDQKFMTERMLDKRPLVMVSGHFGNFEIAGFMLGTLGYPCYAIARRMDNPFIEKLITRFRESKGQFIIPADNSADKIQRVLESGGTLSLLGDQHAGRKGIWIDFLGRPASCHKALALFVMTSEAPMVVSYCRRTDRPMHFEAGTIGMKDPELMAMDEMNVPDITQWYNDQLAMAINAVPEQYWWVHRRWKEKPVRRRRTAKAA